LYGGHASFLFGGDFSPLQLSIWEWLMSLPFRAIVSFITSAGLIAVLVAQAAANSGPSLRVTGTTNQMAMYRSGFLGGVGLMSYQRMLGLGGPVMNAYLPVPLGMGGSPPPPMLLGGYGSGSPQLHNYAQPAATGSGYAQDASAPSGREASLETKPKNPLVALRRHEGGLNWPIALWYMTRDDEAKELRERIDSRFEKLVSPKQNDAETAELLKALRRDIESVRKQFTNLGDDFPMTRDQMREARSFLDKLRDALKQPTAASEVSTQP
jgi:hypothetical protein